MNRNEDIEIKYLVYCLLCFGILLLEFNCFFFGIYSVGYKWVIGLYLIIRVDVTYGGNKVFFIKSYFYFFYFSGVGGVELY